MLTKDVCRKCKEMHSTDHQWAACDERIWEVHGQIICPVRLRFQWGWNQGYTCGYVGVHDNCPKHCLYQLEHLVLSGSGVVET